MAPIIRNTVLLLSLVAAVFVMRQAELSPSTFLRRQLLEKFEEERRVSDIFCQNVDMNDLGTFSEGQKDRADGYRSDMRDLRNDDTLTNFIEREEPSSTFIEKYVKSMVPLLVPWVVFFGLGVIGCLFYVINWCCMNCYLCKNCCRTVCGTPKTNKFKNFFVIFSLAFMVMTVGAASAGLAFSTRIPKYANAALCSTVRFIEDIGNGSDDGKWVGINDGTNQVESLLSKINIAVGGLGIFTDIFNGLAQNVDQTSNALNNIYEQNRDATIQRADPEAGTYQPYFIENLGPISNEASVTGSLNTELNYKREGVQIANSTLNTFVNVVERSANQIINDVQRQIPTLRQVSDGINDSLNKVEDEKSTFDSIVSVVKGVLVGLFAANIVIACLAVASIALVCCGAKYFNKSLHLSWCVLGLLMLLSWVVSTFLMAATIFVFETCDIGQGIIDDPALFNKTFSRLNTVFDINEDDYNKTQNILYRCVHGDGDISEEFNLKSNLVIFEEIFQNVDNYSGTVTSVIRELPTSLVLPIQEEALNKMRTGELPDSEQTVADLIRLNALTNGNTNQCTRLADTWVLNSQNCTQSAGSVFQAGAADDFNVFNPTCIGYNNWMAQEHDISNRYALDEFPQPACGDINGEQEHVYLRNFINGFVVNRNQANALIDRLQGDLANINARNTKFNQDLEKFPQAIRRLNSTIGSVYSSLTNENTGLIATTNCKFVVDTFEEVLDVTCAGLGTSVFQTMIVSIVMSFFTFFGTLMLFCLAKRFTVGDAVMRKSHHIDSRQ